jgi:gamma-glutamyltranspeptidase / glutathione hydrolase
MQLLSKTPIALLLFALPVQALDRTNQGMVTSANPLASQAGLEILQSGGNAIDAAVATTLAISVVEPYSAGLGGGGFALYHGGKQTEALDFRERAPQAATKDMYLKDGKPVENASINGHKSVGIPGTIAGLAELHRKHGKLPWKTLVTPAIRLAEQGFPVSQQYLDALGWRSKVIQQDPEASRIFLRNGGLPKIGTSIIQTDLAKTLASVAEDPNSFYNGTVAKAIVKDMQTQGGIITEGDLRGYKPLWREPICGPFRQFQICSMPPPSSGGIHLLQILNMMDDGKLQARDWHQVDHLHRFIETLRIAYADRSVHLGDPAFTTVPIKALTSKTYAAKRRKEIDPARAKTSQQVQAATPAQLKESEETSHLTVIDKDRNAVSLTFTVNLSFGAGVVAKGTGIVLNNEMDDFIVAPNTPNAFGLTGNQANAIAPGKTPLSSMTPTIVLENNQPRLLIGAPGGSTIITTVTQVILNTLVFEMDIKRAIAAPRLHHQWLPDRTRIDRHGFDPTTLDLLRQRGHKIEETGSWGNANGIMVLPDGSLEGAADPRGEGAAMGY